MKITCALTVDQVEKLYKHAYKSIKIGMKENIPFNVDNYMNIMFDKIANKTNEANAAKFVQQLPALLTIASMQQDTQDAVLEGSDLRKLNQTFRNPDDGFVNTLRTFRPDLSPEEFEKLVNEKKEEILTPKEVTDEEKLNEFVELRLRPFSPLATTMQEYNPLNPEDKTDFTQELLSETRRRIFNTIRNISNQVDPKSVPGLNDVIYEDQVLKLKPILVKDIPAEHLDAHTKRTVERGYILEGKGKQNKNVTPLNERVAMIIVDANGNPVKFNTDGKITEDGSYVYQFTRTVRKEGARYNAKGLYNQESQVTTPAEIANKLAASFDMTLTEYAKETEQTEQNIIDAIDKEQQKELKDLYNFTQQFIKTKEAKLVPITGINEGIQSFAAGKFMYLDTLSESGLSETELLNIYSSLTSVTVESKGRPEGYHTITIDNKKFTIDRPRMTDEIAGKIASALTSSQLTGKEKMNFAEQFIHNNMARSIRRYRLSYIPATDEFSIKIVAEKSGAIDKNVKPVDLTSATAFKEIKDALMFATTVTNPNAENVGQVSATRMRYRADLVNGGYFDFQNGKLVRADYINDVLRKAHAEIFTTSQTQEVFNAYMQFALPGGITEEIDEAKNEIESENFRSYTRELKDNLVNELKLEENNTKDFKVNYIGNTGTNTEGEGYGSFTILNAEGQPVSASIIKKFKKNEGTVKKVMPKLNDSVTLVSEDIETDTEYITDTITVYNSEGVAIAFIKETDYTLNEKPRTKLYQEQKKDLEAKKIKTTDAEKLNPEGTINPSEGDLFDGFDTKSGLKRKTILNQLGITSEDIKRADDWWKTSPLQNFISLGQMANIVNSDVYAEFISAGSTLFEGGKLGKIGINEHTGGNMVDVYHEAWHAFSQLFLTKAEKTALYKEIRSKGGKWKDMSFYDIEEELAEDFRTFSKNPKAKKGRPKRNSLFRRILNWIKSVFENTTKQDVITDLYDISSVKEMFDTLYFSSKNPKLLNKYTPLIDNVMFNEMDRGISQVKNKKEDALNKEESDLFVESADSTLSEMVDQLAIKNGDAPGSKAGSIEILSNKKKKRMFLGTEQNISNREIAFKILKGRFEKQLENRKKELGQITDVSFNSINTLSELKANAAAVMIASEKSGDDKYVFLRSQIDEFNKLNLSSKKGDRLKGEMYHGISIIGDFYSHESITNSKGKRVGIIVVDSMQDATVQYTSYIEGGAKYKALEYNKKPVTTKILTAEQAKLQDDIRILQTVITNFGNEKHGSLAYLVENSSYRIINERQTIINEELKEDEDSYVGDAESINNSDQIADKSVGQKSLEESTEDEVSYVLGSLHKKENKNFVYNRLGFKKLVNYGSMWDNVVRAIGGIEDPVEAYEILNNKLLWQSFPELEQLIKYKLPNPNSADHETEFDITTAFWQTFKRKRTSYMQLTAFNTEDGYVLKPIKASYETGLLRRSFSDNFKTQTIEENRFITRDNNKSKLNLQKVTDVFKDASTVKGTFDVSKSLAFARALGMNLDDLKIIKNELEMRSEYYGLPYIYSIIKDLSALELQLQTKAENNKLTKQEEFKLTQIEIFKKDPVAELSKSTGLSTELFGKEITERTQIERIAILHGKYGSQYANFSVLNPEGNVVYEHIDDQTASRRVYALNKAKKLTDLWTKDEFKHMSDLNPATNSFTKRSQILKNLFNFYDGGQFNKLKDKSLELFIDSGTQNAEIQEGVVTTGLDYYGKFLQEMNLMLKEGIQEFIRHASKSSSFGIVIRGGIDGPISQEQSKLYVDLESLLKNGSGETYAFEEIILPYMAAEFERLKRFRANPEEFKKYKGYNRRMKWDGKEYYAGELFTAFDDVLNNNIKNQIYNLEGTDLIEALNNNPSLKAKMAESTKNYFDNQTTNSIAILRKNRFIDPKLRNKLAVHKLTEAEIDDALVRTYVYNSFIHNFETIGLLYGDMAQYNHAKDHLHKRNTGLTSGGLGVRTDISAQNFIQNVWNKGSYATTLDARYKNIKYNGTINTAVLEDVKRTSIYIDEIANAWRKDYAIRFKKVAKEDLKDALNEIELSKLGSNPTKPQLVKALVESRVARDIDEYKNMEEGDGQGLITFDTYRMLKKLSKQWSPEQEDLFQDIIHNREINPSDIKEFFPVYKLQYYGPIADALLPLTGMHKFSLMPLIPTMVGEGSDMDNLHKQMMEKDIQYVVFESGSKVSGITKDGSPDKIYDNEEQKDIVNNIEFTINKIYGEYLKDVTKVPNKFKKKTIFATQLRKVIIESLYNNGEVPVGIDKQKVKAYDDAVDEYTEILTIELLNDIGFEYKYGAYTGDLNRFVNVIHKELGRKAVPKHLIKMIGVNQENKINIDLSLHLEADTIEKTIISLIEKRLIKQKVKGEGLVQVSSATTNGTWDRVLRQKFDKASKADIKKFLGSNNLPFYHQVNGKTKLMKVAIALQGDFLNLLNLKDINGEVIETRERLNEMIKDDNWLDQDDGSNRKAVTLAGVRIPTQTLGFIESMEVYEFLDPAASNIIILPSEIVVKNGSDFDVDKMTTFMPSIDASGKFITSNVTNEELKKEISKIKEDKGKGISVIIRNQKNALENNLIQAIKGIVELPSNFAQLTKPTGTNTLRPIAMDLQKYVSEFDKFENVYDGPRIDGKNNDIVISPTRTLEVPFNLDKHSANLIGKEVLGIAAIENALHPLLNQIDAKMPASYKAQIYSEDGYVDIDVDYKMRLKLRHNSTTNSKNQTVISLSDIYSVDGIEKIADLFSESVNGLVDVEADAWIFYIQANPELAPVLFYLFKAGVPAKDAIYFVSNPLVRKYAEKQRLLSSAYEEIVTQRGEVIANPLIKYMAADQTLTESMSAKEKIAMEAKVNTENLKALIPVLEGKSIVEYYQKGKKNTEFATKAEMEQLLNNEDTIINLIITEKGDKIYKLRSSPVSTSKYYQGASVAMEEAGIGTFNKNELYKIVKGEGSEKTKIAAFMHFLEIEKQIKGLNSLKRLANPDTTRSKTAQELVGKIQGLEELMTNSKVDSDTVLALVNESILSSFYKNELVLKLLEPLFKLRNNSVITKFILDKLGSPRIADRYGSDQEAVSQFIREFKNGVVNYIYQNRMSNFVNSKGEVIDYPDLYKGYKVNTSTKNIPGGVEINSEKEIITINPGMLSDDYDYGYYLRSSTAEKAYTNRGLTSFTEENDPFVSESGIRNKKSSFFKYSIERAITKLKNPIELVKDNKEYKRIKAGGLTPERAYEEFLTKRALINAFNRKFLMQMETYSFSQTILDVIKDFPSLKVKYPVLQQLTPADTIGDDKVLTLADKNRVEGDLASSYYHNLKELADVNIKKVSTGNAKADKKDNAYISKLFKMFPLVMLYQHGIGYSKNGFNAALPFQDFTDIMQDASNSFMQNQLNDNTLEIIYGRLLSKDKYKDYVVSEEEYNGYNKADKEGTMSFQYGDNKRDDVVSDNTFEAILQGERTATTRYYTNDAYAYWAKAKPGQIIKFWSGDKIGEGQMLLVKVTDKRLIDFSKMSDEEIEDWSKLEGWSFEYGAKHRNPGFSESNKGIQILYELIDSAAVNRYEGSEDPEDKVLESESIFTTPIEPTQLVRGSKIINDTDVQSFNEYVRKSNGSLPKAFFTSSTIFKAFYNTNTGKNERAPQSSKWMLIPKSKLYSLVDQATGEVYIDNVDLSTGIQFNNKNEKILQGNQVIEDLDIATLLTNGLVNTKGLTKVDVEDAEVFTKQVFNKEESEQIFNFIEKLYKNTYETEHKASDKFGKGRRSMYFSDTAYSYSGTTRSANIGSPELQRLISKIETELGFEKGYFDMALINEYKDGSQKIGFHTDNEPILNNKGKLNPSVVTISFGDERTMILNGRGKRYEIPMKSGLGLIMGKDGQINYKHGIDAEGNKSKRFSITLRHNAEKSQAVNKTFAQPASELSKKNLFTVTPIQSADKKAIIKASIATQYIGFGEGITGSSTETYRQQAGEFANTGNYSTNDVIFVSIGGKRGTALQQKTQQDRTIKEAIKAVEAGATILTDNKAYTDSSTYNTGEKRLYANMEAKGYNYSEVTVDGQLLGTWSKPTSETVNIYAGTNENAELSNFANRPFVPTSSVPVALGIIENFKTVEGAFQAEKLLYTDYFSSLQIPPKGKTREDIVNERNEFLRKLSTATGAEAKRIGKTIPSLNITNWDDNSSRIMKDLLKSSFEQNPNALQILLATGNKVLTHTQDKSRWGTEFPKLLMEVREELRPIDPGTQLNLFGENKPAGRPPTKRSGSECD